MAVSDVVEVDDRTFEELVEGASEPVVVMFYSPECRFCRDISPYYADLAGEYAEIVRFVRVNVLASPWTVERYAVRSTPTFAFFCHGKKIREMVGSAYPAIIKRTVEDALLYGEECAESSNVINYDVTGYA